MRELQTILTVAVSRLAADTELAAFAEVISEDKGNIDNEIMKTVATLKKVSVLVMIRSASTDSPNAAGPVIDDAEIFVEVAENVLLNRKKDGVSGEDYLTALDVAQIVASTDSGLHQFIDETTGVSFLAESSGPFLKPSPPPPGATTAYTLYFKTTGVVTGNDD